MTIKAKVGKVSISGNPVLKSEIVLKERNVNYGSKLTRVSNVVVGYLPAPIVFAARLHGYDPELSGVCRLINAFMRTSRSEFYPLFNARAYDSAYKWCLRKGEQMEECGTVLNEPEISVKRRISKKFHVRSSRIGIVSMWMNDGVCVRAHYTIDGGREHAACLTGRSE